jgi:hypothetical protein
VLHVDHRAGQLEVVAGVERERRRRADLLDELILRPGAAPGRAVGSGASAAWSPLRLVRALLEPLARGDLAHRRDLALALGTLGARADARVGLVLLGPQALELGEQPATGLVELDHLIECLRRALAAALQRGAHAVGVLADAPEVEQGSSFSRAAPIWSTA